MPELDPHQPPAGDFRGRTILVTGGARGIGRGIAACLLARGASVVIADIDADAGRATERELATPAARFVHTDVGSEASVENCIAETISGFGELHGLVNNAGIANPGHTPLMSLSREAWETMLRTNLTGAFLMTKHAVPHLAVTRGAIVNIASTRALQSEPNTEAYAAAKGGLLSLTHALAISLGDAIRVNAILPGWIDVSRPPARLSDQDHRQHPAGRVGRPADIAALTAFLLSDEAGFITGQPFVVDGGMTRKMIYWEDPA
jgi:NAD(P)-dependent dehydrogenase (short-subunit alcohol dehydrogenase family)